VVIDAEDHGSIPTIATGGGWNHLMSELTPKSDSTSGKNNKKKIYIYILDREV
jgi:hypothetical protein